MTLNPFRLDWFGLRSRAKNYKDKPDGASVIGSCLTIIGIAGSFFKSTRKKFLPMAVIGLALGYVFENWNKFFTLPVPTNPTDKSTKTLVKNRDDAFANLERIEADYFGKLDKLKASGQEAVLDDPTSKIRELEKQLQDARVAAGNAHVTLRDRLDEYEKELDAQQKVEQELNHRDSIQRIEKGIY